MSFMSSAAEPAPAEAVRTIDALLRLRAATHPNNSIVSYPSSEDDFVEYTAADLDRMTTLTAALYSRSIPEHALQPGTVVGIVGVGNLEYIVTFLALQRLGVTCLFLSTRLADAGFIHLIRETRCQAVLPQKKFLGALQRVRDAVGRSSLAVVPMLEDSYILNPLVMDIIRPVEVQFSTPRDDIPGWIIHSSGTTGLPKPVPIYAHRAIANLVKLGRHPDTLSTLPLFHSFGLSNLNHAIVSGTKLSLMSANRPITGPAILAALDQTQSMKLVTVPYVLQLLAETDGWEERLARMSEVTFGGSPIPEELGERLIAAGVNLTNHYGLSECGGRMMRPSADQWNWLNVLPHAAPHVRFEHEGEDVFRLVVLPGLPTKAAGFTNRDDGSYDTKDLFQQHPTDKDKWRFVGRQDDTIVLVNGEKANSIPFELAVRKNPDVQAAVVFGEQRDSLGMIAILAETNKSKEEVKAEILREIEAVNETVPAYARIPEDGVIIKGAGTSFPCTDKGTIIRTAFYKQFAADIDAHYSGTRGSSGDSTESSEEQIQEMVRKTVQDVLRLKGRLSDNADFFAMGMDSLQATNVRVELAKGVDPSIPTNVVFENPSVELLTRYLVRRQKGHEDSAKRSAEEIAWELVNKYSNFERVRTAGNSRQPDKETILLTGATGSLGGHILATLLRRDSVERVYCLVRAKSPELAMLRTQQTLRSAHLRFSDHQWRKLAALPYDMSQERLGLAQDAYDEIVASATGVIHNAWAVDFNMQLRSFESHCIRGSWRLLQDVCLRSPHAAPPSFSFVSSVSTITNTPTRAPEDAVPERPARFGDANSTGYGQSKWVVEQLCAEAARRTGLRARVLRLGQVVGDTARGEWNPKEAIPLTVRAVLATGALPLHDGRERLSWLPVDTAAAAVVELSLGEHGGGGEGGVGAAQQQQQQQHAIYHVCNPQTISWNEDFLPALRQAGLRFEALPGPEWVRRLEQTEPDAERNPPMKLLDWFRRMYGGGGGAGGEGKRHVPPRFDTAEGQRAAVSLREAGPMDGDMVAKFLRFWMNEAWALPTPVVGRANM